MYLTRRHFTTLSRVVKTGFLNFVRNTWLSIAAMAVMVITLTIVLFLIIANATFNHTLKQLNDKIDISLYLKDEVTPEQRGQLVTQIKALPNIAEVNYFTKDQALESYKNDNAGNVVALSAISVIDNPLPAKLQIKLIDVNKISDIKPFLDKKDVKALEAAETSYSGPRKEAVDKITGATSFLRKGALIGVIIFAVISILIILNTIRMAIFNRRDELTISRLLGASTWYIRGPFVVETVMYGVVAAIISVAVCSALFSVSSSTFQASSLGLLDIKFASQYFANRFWQILLIQLAIGILIGAASSFFATRRYLKFKSPN